MTDNKDSKKTNNSKDAKTFRINMSDDDIKKNLLTNCIKMLMAREELRGYDWEKSHFSSNYTKVYYERLSKSEKDGSIYVINADPVTPEIIEKNDQINIVLEKYAIKIYSDTLNSVNIQPLKDFINDYSEYKKIIIVKNFSKKPYQEFVSNPNTEIFNEFELMVCLVEANIIPACKLMRTKDERKKFEKKYNLKKSQFNTILAFQDQLALFYNLKPEDIILILRPSETALVSPAWRRAVKGNRFATLKKK